MSQPLHDFGGNGPTMTVAVANGFPPQTYRPLVEPLTAHYHVISPLPRALWGTESPPARRINWKRTVAQDFIDTLRAHDLRDVMGVGHSFGGIATLLAAIVEPSRFRAVILLDPTILPAVAMWFNRVQQWLDVDWFNPLAKGALRRRTTFDSWQAAYDRLRHKALFADWHEDAFQGYIDALRETDDGRVTLAWPAEWEAYYFRTIYTGTWRELPKLRGTVPLMTIRGGTSDTLFPPAAARMQHILPEMTYHEIPGHGHLFPQSAPDATRALITDWLQ